MALQYGNTVTMKSNSLKEGFYLQQNDVRWPRARLLMDAGKKKT